MSYVKLKDLVNRQFTIQEVKGFSYKLWDQAQKTMLFSPTFVKGYRKIWALETSEGTLDVSASQLGTMLESVCYNGNSVLKGKSFEVKSNGKEGQEIRYFFNLREQPKEMPQANTPYEPQPGVTNFEDDDSGLPF